jgi:PadR family transcriptional regulator PadR
MPPSADLLQGTLDMLILKSIALKPEHGWAIAQRIQQVSNDVLQVGQGSLYPALHRLEYKGWIRAQWGASENNRRARFYSLTAAGRRQLEAELAELGSADGGDQFGAGTDLSGSDDRLRG